MEKGDISNTPAVRLVWVFETTIGYLTEKDERRHERALRFHRYKQAAGMWSLDKTAANAMWDYAFRKSYSCDIVTYLHPLEAEAVHELLDGLGYPFGNFTATTIEEVARGLANNPSVAVVFDGDPHRAFTYGFKGRQSLVL